MAPRRRKTPSQIEPSTIETMEDESTFSLEETVETPSETVEVVETVKEPLEPKPTGRTISPPVAPVPPKRHPRNLPKFSQFRKGI